nr:diguanylate cyclase [Planctomycetota bacterium]
PLVAGRTCGLVPTRVRVGVSAESFAMVEARPARQVLLLDDCPEDALLVEGLLQRVQGADYRLQHVDTVPAAAAVLAESAPDAVLLDLHVGETTSDPLGVLKHFLDEDLSTPIVVLTSNDDEELAVEAVRLGAQDYVLKQQATGPRLHRAIEYALERWRLLNEISVARAELERMALTDPLTQLANRRCLDLRLETLQRGAGRTGEIVCAALVDVDDFKAVNDGYGHAAGDAVLKDLGLLIQSTVRPGDLAGRIGGDEFIVLYPSTRVSDAVIAAERLRSRIRTHAFLEGTHAVEISVSIGVAPIPPDVMSIDEVLPHVAHSLKSSKEHGKNCVRTLLDPRTEHLDRQSCRPRQAVKHLRPHLQPILDLRSERVVAYELLARGPEGPCEYPLDMFQAAHEEGILVKTDLACLAVCAEAADVLPETHPVHINVFPQTLETVEPARILEALGGAPADRVCLEVNEQHLAGSHEAVSEALGELRRHGVRVALDHLGLGRGSLESLIMLEPDFVKLSGSLVTGVSRSASSRRRLARLVAAVHSLRRVCIAEGIEAEPDLEFVREIGVRLGQGFLLGNPRRVSQTHV